MSYFHSQPIRPRCPACGCTIIEISIPHICARRQPPDPGYMSPSERAELDRAAVAVHVRAQERRR